ncbi:MAG: metallopeptidase TldD-related protein [Planctomycetota bacterium]
MIESYDCGRGGVSVRPPTRPLGLRALLALVCASTWCLSSSPALVRATPPPATADAPRFHPLVKVLEDELEYSTTHLVSEGGVRPYYLSYTITDVAEVVIRAQLGALYGDDSDRRRSLDVDVRVGDYTVDNTRKIRGGAGRRAARFGGGASFVGLEDDPVAIQHAIWGATDDEFKAAIETYQQVVTNQKTMVDEDQEAADFSREAPSQHAEPLCELTLDRAAWAQRARNVSRLALAHPLIYSSGVTVTGSAENRFLVTSEGTRIQTSRKLLRVVVSAATRAEDGMDLSQSHIFDTTSEGGLPTEAEITEAFQKVIDKVLALRAAPLVEPYTGPAILLHRASGVFFHEIFGHRIEGHRQKDVEEGQTFTKMVGKSVLPGFLAVYDDPTRSTFGNQELRGFYRFDDEGVPASRVDLVEGGILKRFLQSRSPLAGFPQSNGHGRREPGRDVVSRQANLIVESTNVVPFDRLRALLLEECKKQDKPFGFLFEDITGGFTTTQRSGPQAFKVLPVVVYRVYVDGRPDELVRGVDIVGTPLSCFSKILCTADDPAVFNGSCGAESGWVPVSAISPSILVEQIEIEKRERSQERLPILASPVAESEAAPAKSTSDQEGF